MSKPWTTERVDKMIEYRSSKRGLPRMTRDRILKYLKQEEGMIAEVYGRKLDEKTRFSDHWYETMDIFINKITVIRHLQSEYAPPEQSALFPPDEIKPDIKETGYDI